MAARRIRQYQLTTQTGSSLVDLSFVGVLVLVLLAQGLNIVFVNDAWPFILAVLFLLASPAFQFLTFIYAYLDAHQASADAYDDDTESG